MDRPRPPSRGSFPIGAVGLACLLCCTSQEEAPKDAGGPADAAGTELPSDGSVPVGDAALPDAAREDAGTGSDAGPVAIDAGLPPQGADLLGNGSFERWTSGLPDEWFGATTNLSSDSVVEDTTTAHDGLRSCQLINPDSGHRRFSTQAMSLPAGRFHCSYWVRGSGEIRNAHYDGDYSGYSAYVTIDSDEWRLLSYDFNLAADASGVFELVFSVRNTGEARGHLRIDHVRCTRDIEACDSIPCESWQRCENSIPGCVPSDGFCASASDCQEWQECASDHRCVSAPGRCAGTAECDPPTPVCDPGSHTCVAGDPCAGVSCDEWKECNPGDATCVLRPGRCMSTRDCTSNLPVCDVQTHTCEAVDHASNVVPNGGFEAWEDVSLGGASTYHLPVSWYGVCEGCTPYFPTTELDPNAVAPYGGSVHGGSLALQITKAGMPADRFVSEPFPVAATTTYSCAYWVRGKGDHRHRAYCGGWAPDTQYTAVDSDAWQQVPFELTSSSSWCVLIFYVSNTDAARDQVQLDDVVCSPKFP